MTAAALLLAASPAFGGPPWISVETPSNPHHSATRGALFLIHAYHHDRSIAAPVTATAEGLIDGQRRSVRLTVTETSRSGVYAVRGALPEDGAWVAVVKLSQSPTSTATALVRLGPGGQVAAVTVPSRQSGDGWTVPRELRPGEVDATLREAARIAALETTSPSPFGIAGLAGLPLVLLLAGVALVRQRD